MFPSPQLHGIHGTFRFRNKVNVLYLALIKSDGPIRVVMPDRGGNIESVRQLDIHGDIRAGIELCRKIVFPGGIVQKTVVTVILPNLFPAFCKSFSFQYCKTGFLC